VTLFVYIDHLLQGWAISGPWPATSF